MFIHKLRLKNFRGFSEQTFNFNEQFNVLIGDNGTGKTAVLDALAVGLGSFFLGMPDVPDRPIYPDDVRYKYYHFSGQPTVERQYPTIVECEGTINEKSVYWQRTLKSNQEKITKDGAGEIESLSKKLQNQVMQGESVLLPIIAYYGTGRLWKQIQNKGKILEPGSRIDGYLDSLEPTSNEKSFLDWIKTQEINRLQETQFNESNQQHLVLDTVQSAIANCIEGWSRVFYDLREDSLMAVSDDGDTLPFRMLSDGVRNILAMVGDIAHRAAILNPFLDKDVTSQVPGVVMIDEIGLHLHPKWQRRVVNDLRETFPKIQFIVTTHSPFIIQSLRPNELIDLNAGEQIPAEFEKSSIEDITEDVMGVEVPQRSQRYQEMMKAAEDYYKTLQEVDSANSEEVEQLKEQLDELVEPFSENAAYQAFLNMERTAVMLKKEKESDEAG